MKRILSLLAATIVIAIPASGQDEPAATPSMSVNDLMVTIVTPATNTLWGIEDPQTAEDWQIFIDAADVVIEAGNSMKSGGTGPNDKAWAADPAWQSFSEALIAAGRDARQAALDRDVDAMYAAGDVLYPPCEECHLQFHPGVREQ